MKYFIGHLIEGEAANWHESIARDISDKFDTWKLHEKIPPHITIFYPFSKEDISSLVNFLQNWVAKRNVPGEFSILDFGHFEDRVVFAKIDVPHPIKNIVVQLQDELQKFPDMPHEEFPNWHPHATLANRLSSQEIDQIWTYVQTLKKPNFSLPFNNVTLFRFEGDMKWVVERTFRFKEKGDSHRFF
ncbi:MAG: hypothetical protein UV60_C0013G0018 [Parcubacteria group bacterium GW2011_GWA2_43_11]|nr:MAG: hypothetical protein UV60_C0013G0018 [Parcubacteria group bacterium GW2011_GWA2_43_11]